MNPIPQRKKTIMKKIIIAVVALIGTAAIATFAIDRLKND